MVVAQEYTGMNRRKYKPGPELGRGGEGTVYSVSGDDGIVLKLYNEKQTADKSMKLKFMCSVNNSQIHPFTAWPLDIVSDNTGGVVGFTMKKIREAVPLHRLFSPMDRKMLFPDKGYNFLLHVCRNLAAAFHTLHAAGFVVGDINEGNILVNNSGMINFIDCDSFQVNNNGHIHFCEVGVPRYTPPELLKLATFENVVRTVNTDVFSMGVLMFQLMFLGRHPFAGRTLFNDEINEETAIKNNYFFYSLTGKSKGLLPPTNSLTLTELPEGLADLFQRTFEKIENRPQAEQWIKNIDVFLRTMVKCERSNLHYYSKNSSSCPWCAFKERQGILFFIDTVHSTAQSFSDIHKFIQGFKIEKLPISQLNTDYTTPGLAARPIHKKFYLYRSLSIIAKAVFVIGPIAAGFLSPLYLLAISLAFCVDYIFTWKDKMKHELKVRTLDYNTAKSKYDRFVNELTNSSDLKLYDTITASVSQLVYEFKSLPEEFRKRQRQIEEKLYEEQLHAFLKNFDIRNHSIPSFAAGKKKILIDNMIMNASDISKLHNRKVPGIGPTNSQILFSWQRQAISKFSYVPDTDKLNSEIRLATTEFKKRQVELELKIKQEYTRLQNIKSNFLAKQKILETNITQLKPIIYQAAVDLEEFQKLM